MNILGFRIIKEKEFNKTVHSIAALKSEKIIEEEKEKIEQLVQERVEEICNNAEFIDDLRSGTDIYLDFTKKNYEIFSVERCHHGTINEKTIVGLTWIEDGERKSKQWSLMISRNHHNELVQKLKTQNNQ